MLGLSHRKTTDAISSFVRQHASATPRRAVFCTYDFHAPRFEAVVLPQVTRRGRFFRTLVLADQAALQRPGALTQRGAGPRYELAPVRLKGPGVFHPKLVVLQAGPRVLVGIGSSNLTPGGLAGIANSFLGRDDMEAVETECLAAGGKKCVFVCKPREKAKI